MRVVWRRASSFSPSPLSSCSALQDACPALTLPVGLPWIGARFRADALTSFFQIVINLGAAAASLFALGYGQHEEARGRVLPFYPAFLAGMNLVLLADDAFSYLIAWEFMSLSSWALVLAHHRDSENSRAGYIYILMASFGTLALLLAFGLLAGPGGSYGFSEIRVAPKPTWLPGLVLGLDIGRSRLEGRIGSLACLVAPRASSRTQSRLGVDERGDDEGRDIRLYPYCIRFARAAGMVVEHRRAWRSAARRP